MISLLKKLWAGLKAAHERRELYALSDHTLKDIGLDRGRIEQLFR